MTEREAFCRALRDASVSQEYLNLYRAGLMTDGELNATRETGLASA